MVLPEPDWGSSSFALSLAYTLPLLGMTRVSIKRLMKVDFGSDRPHHAYIEASVCARGYILIYGWIHYTPPSFPMDLC